MEQHSKPGPYYPMYGDDFDQGCRSAGLDPAQTGAYAFGMNLQWRLGGPFTRKQYEACTPWHPRTSSRLLDELVDRGKFTETDGLFSNARMAAEIVKFRERSAAAAAREQRKKKPSNTCSEGTSTGVWRASKPAKLSEKGNGNSGTPTTETALLRIKNLDSSPSSPPLTAGDAEEEEAFNQFWQIWPESQYKRAKAECRNLFRSALTGDLDFDPVPVADLLAAARAHARKAEQPRFAGQPSKWLRRGGWLDYAKASPARRADPTGSTLPWFDDASRLQRMDADGPYTVEQRLDALLSQGTAGWHPELGDHPMSGECTALHDYIADKPGLLRRLHRRYGTEFPGALQDRADIADAGNILPFAVRGPAVDGRAIA